MVRGYFSIALLLALGQVVGSVGQTEDELPNTAVIKKDQEGLPYAIHIPSPFAEPVQSTATRGVPMENQWRCFKRVPDAEISPADANDLKQIVIESFTLGVDATSADKILALLDAGTLQVTDNVITEGTFPFQGGNGDPTDRSQGSESIEISSPTSYGQISDSQFSEIREIVESSSNNQISPAAKIIVHENQLATISDGGSAPFVVSTQPGPNGHGGFRNVPVIQPIEFGIIARHRANVTESGIRLNSRIILNDIYKVSESTFSNVNSPFTVQIPYCHCKQVNCSIELADGNRMLIDPNFLDEKSDRSVSVGRLFNNPRTENEYAKVLIVLRATVVE